MGRLPTVIVLRPIVPRYLLPFLYAIVGFYLVDQIRIVTASLELVPRLVFLVEMLAGTVWSERNLAHVEALDFGRKFRLDVACHEIDAEDRADHAEGIRD